MSNFLGDARPQKRRTFLLSSAELAAREGVELHTSMNYRADQTSVFLVLPNHSGEYREVWSADSETYTFEGHDSKTSRGGDSTDQLLMYESGRLSQNGRFFSAAQAQKQGMRAPLQIQVYEKIDAGVWFDKGIFNLRDAHRHVNEGNIVFTFDLQPADFGRTDRDADYFLERMIPVVEKVEAWARDHGRCTCGRETTLRFVRDSETSAVSLRCAACRGEHVGLLG